MKKVKKSGMKGFTLAEVLITLGIIGVVAALTLPTLIRNYEEKATVTKVKKVYTTLANAVQLAAFEKGDFVNTKADSGQAYWEYLSPYLKVSKFCGTGRGCWPDTMVKHLDGTDWLNVDRYTNYTKAILDDGTLLQLYTNTEIRVDINGFKAPNTVGKDIFAFWIVKNKFVPQGLASEENDVDTVFQERCNLSSTISYNGMACAAWVLHFENMDYLHCNDLSWSGKHKCSD